MSFPEGVSNHFSDGEREKEPLPRRLVVKCGTKNLCRPNNGGKLAEETFDDYARQVVELQRRGVEVIVVSSGAIKAGREKLEELGLNVSNCDKQVLAAVGQSFLMERWNKAFEKFGKTTGQLLVTFTNWSNERERSEVLQCILDILKSGQTPIINENDPVSDKEIKLMERRISENDQLAKMIARKVGADAILFLTDEGGIYTADPKVDSSAQLYEEINMRDRLADLIGSSKNTSNESGTGGMAAKLKEALRCAKEGLRVAVAGREENVILKFAKGELVGTRIGIATKIKEN